MKRMLIVAFALSLLGGAAASAQDWRRDNGHNGRADAGRSYSSGRSHDDRGRGDGQQSYRAQGGRNLSGRGQIDRGPPDRGQITRNQGPRSRPEVRNDPRSYGYRGDERGYDNRAYANPPYQNRGYDNRGYGPPRAWARGQRLPPAYMAAGVDYNRYHLRRPPRGYQWVRVDNDYVLAAVATGLIMEVITGGY